MKVSEQGVVVKNATQIQMIIKQKYRNMRNFAKKVEITESMMSHILHGRRKVYPWTEAKITELLDITQENFREMIGEQNNEDDRRI